MDTPTPPSGAPRRILKPSGTAPVAKRRLVSASGKPIEGKAAAAKPASKLLSASGKPIQSKPSLLKKPAEEKPPVEEKPLSPEEIAAEEARLQAEHEEYERQMEEYNRQMEEYNKQVAEQEEAARIAAEKEAAEKAEAERIAAEKAAEEKAEADRISAVKAAEEKAEAERLAAIEKAAADAARVAQEAEQAAALAAAKLAAAETAMAAAAAAQAAAEALEAAKAAGVTDVKVEPTPAAASAKPPASKLLVKKPAGTAKAPSTALLRSAAATAAAKSESKPPATKMLAAANKTARKVEAGAAPAAEVAEAAPQSAKPTTKLAAGLAPKLNKAASTTTLKSAAAKPKLAKAAAPKTGLSLNKLGGIKKPAAQPAVPAPDAEPVPASEAAAPADDAAVAADVPADEVPAEPSEEELSVRDAYLEALQLDASATPIWKKPVFLIACGALLLLGGGAAYYVSSVNATKEAYAQNVAETNRLLRQAGAINKAGAETLEDVEKKGIKLDCSLADAKRLMDVIVDPFQKDENGVNRYGGAPEGVAMNAGMLLGIMAEKDPAIETMIFKSLEQDARKISPMLFSWMIQRLGVANVKNINGKLKTLTEKIAGQPKFKTKPKQLAAIWEVMGLRVTAKDLPVILSLLTDKEIDSELVATLAICLDNIVEMTEDADAKVKMGDQIFDSVPEKYRGKVMRTMASACSPKALEYYKDRLEDKNNWPRECEFLGAWGNDDLVDYALELYNGSKDDTRMNPFAKGAIGIAFRQARERDQATVDKLMSVLYDKLDEDSSQWQEIINKTDPDAAGYVGDDSPELKELKAKQADLEVSRRQKIGLAKALGAMRSFTWIENLLAKLAKDGDEDVVIAAEAAQESIKANSAAHTARKATYERRSK